MGQSQKYGIFQKLNFYIRSSFFWQSPKTFRSCWDLTKIKFSYSIELFSTIPKKVRSGSFQKINFYIRSYFFCQSQKKVRSFWDLTKIKILYSIVLFFTVTKKSTIILRFFENLNFTFDHTFFDIHQKVQSFREFSKIIFLYSIELFFENHQKKYDHFWHLTNYKNFKFYRTFFWQSQKKVRSF